MTSAATTPEELQKLCEEWKPRLGLEDWRIACEFKDSDDLPEGATGGTCDPHQATKTAIICVLSPGNWNPRSQFMRHFPETMSTEWLLVHEMLHIVLDQAYGSNRPEDELLEVAQEQAVEKLARSLLVAYGCITQG